MQRLRTRLRASASTGAPPSLSLDFLGLNQTLDSRITFSRGSNATLVDSTGKVTYAPNNLLTYSQEFDNAAWTKTNATVTANSATAPDGTSTADSLIENTVNGVHDARRSVTASALTTYTQSIFVKASGRTRGQMQMFGNSGGSTINYDLTAGTATAAGAYGGWTGASATITNYGNGWYRIANTATTNAGLTSLVAAYFLADASGNPLYTGDGTSGMLYWGAQVEAVTYQTTPSTYNATTASAYYGPRFDYDPVTLNPKGLLIEEQRTNLLLRSQEFDNASWVKSNLTVTANAAVAPDGATTADKIVKAAVTTQASILQTATTVVGAQTVSFFAKAAEYDTVSFTLYNSTDAHVARGQVNLSTGAVIVTSNGVISTQSVGNGWWRITATGTTTVAGNAFYIYPKDVTTYLGNGVDGIYVWGAQIEAGSFATSYIPTVASTVTRSADAASITGANFSGWYNQSEGTLAAEFTTGGLGAINSVVASSDGTATNEIYAYANTTSVLQRVATAGVQQVSSTAGASAANTTYKLAMAYKLNDFAVSLAGAAAVTDTSGTVPTVDRLTIGARGALSSPLNGHIRRIAYYPTRLANYQLQGLTA